MNVTDHRPADKHVLDRAQVRILELFDDLDVVELDVEELVDALEHAPDLDVVLELDRDLVVDEGFEEAFCVKCQSVFV